MSSPFSKHISDSLARLTESLAPRSANIGVTPQPVINASITEPQVIVNAPRSYLGNMLADYRPYLRNPIVIFITLFILVLSGVVIARKSIWKKKEDRPGVLTISMYVLVGFMPVFFWLYTRSMRS